MFRSLTLKDSRCARNCFLCPICRNTLSVVPSDPPDSGDGRLSSIPISTVGEPPFFLYCNHCRWDSAEVGITFEKPTGLAGESSSQSQDCSIQPCKKAQLQRSEDSAPESLEFERLKEHFEPFLRTSSSSSALPTSAPHHSHTSSITAAASAALSRDIPGVSKYNPFTRSRGGRDKTANKDEMPEYRSRVEIATASALGTGGGDTDAEFMRHIETVGEVTSFEQRSTNSWAMSLQTRYLFRVHQNDGAHIFILVISNLSGYHYTLKNLSAVPHAHTSSSNPNRRLNLFVTRSNSLPPIISLPSQWRCPIHPPPLMRQSGL